MNSTEMKSQLAQNFVASIELVSQTGSLLVMAGEHVQAQVIWQTMVRLFETGQKLELMPEHARETMQVLAGIFQERAPSKIFDTLEESSVGAPTDKAECLKLAATNLLKATLGLLPLILNIESITADVENATELVRLVSVMDHLSGILLGRKANPTTEAFWTFRAFQSGSPSSH